MNKARRKVLNAIRNTLGELLSQLEDVRDEENATVDAMPENLQGSQRYEKAAESAASLEEACDSVQQAMDQIDLAVE